MDISQLEGKVFSDVTDRNNDLLEFRFENGTGYKLCHNQDCCESVYLEDTVGDLSDLVGVPIISAQEIDSDGRELPELNGDVEQWTFYRIRTIKGTVTLRFYGSSNGCYSTSVDFGEILIPQ